MLIKRYIADSYLIKRKKKKGACGWVDSEGYPLLVRLMISKSKSGNYPVSFI